MAVSSGPGMSDFCRAMVDASPMPMAFLTGSNHVIRYVNPAFCRVMNVREEDIAGGAFAEVAPDGNQTLERLDRVYRTGKAETHMGLGDDGTDLLNWPSIIWPVLDSDTDTAGIMIQVTETTSSHVKAVAMNQALVIGSVRQHELIEEADKLNQRLLEEITHRQQTEVEMETQKREITASERRFRGLVEAIPQVVWTALPDGTLDFVNAKWMDCFGVDEASFNKSGWSMLLSADEQDRSVAAWRDGLKSMTTFQVEHRLKNLQTEEYRWFFTRASPIVDTDNTVLKWFGTTTDIDEHKRGELAMFAKQRFEGLGVLAGGMAHDFNNLLCIILGSAGLLRLSLPESHPLQETITDIAEASERGAELTRQMLAYAGKGRFLIQAVDINNTVRSTCDLLKASISKSVRIEVDTDPYLAPVLADSGQMQQIVMNLVLNAAESAGELARGLVSVKTIMIRLSAELAAQGDFLTGSIGTGNYVVIEVKDNGSGMDEETRSRILEPFFTTKFTGRGLGLSAVGGIVRNQNGALEVRSKLGSGSCFRVYLPALPMQRARPPSDAAQAAQEVNGVILLVDDEEKLRRIAKAGLEDAGFTVLLASGGEEALSFLQVIPALPISVIVLDLSMPVMSGRQVMEEIRRLGIDIPILISSGYSETAIEREVSGLTIAGIIQNPFTVQQLAARVQELLLVSRH